ncbi:hypothetical protein Tco_1348126 [Tanacetum coccineum]
MTDCNVKVNILTDIDVPNQHDVDDDVPLAQIKRKTILDIMAHNNLFLFNLPNNFVNETTIAQKKRKREENLKNWKREDVIVIDDNDVPNELAETKTNLLLIS